MFSFQPMMTSTDFFKPGVGVLKVPDCRRWEL